jgi:hypothetical protein
MRRQFMIAFGRRPVLPEQLKNTARYCRRHGRTALDGFANGFQ